jgi:pantoate kinase
MNPEPGTKEKLLEIARRVAPQIGLSVDEVVELCHEVAAGVALEHALSYVSPGLRGLILEAIQEDPGSAPDPRG